MLTLRIKSEIYVGDSINTLLDKMASAYGPSDLINNEDYASVYDADNMLVFDGYTWINDYFQAEKTIAFTLLTQHPDTYAAYECKIYQRD